MLCVTDILFKQFPDGFQASAIAETSYSNKDMCEFESSQKDESRAQSADSLKDCSKPRAFNGRNGKNNSNFYCLNSQQAS